MNIFKCIITVFILIVSAGNALAQEPVTASFNERKTEIVIQNNRGEVIYIFRQDISKSVRAIKVLDKKIRKNKNLLTFDCLNVKESFVMVLPGQKKAFRVKPTNTKQLHYYSSTKDNVDVSYSIPIQEPSSAEKQIAQDIEVKKPVLKNPREKGDTAQILNDLQKKLENILARKNISIDSSIIKKQPEEAQSYDLQIIPPSVKADKKTPAAKQPEINQDEIFNAFKDEYQRINSGCQDILTKGANLQAEDKQLLKEKQRELNKLKGYVEQIEPANSQYEKLRKNIISRITSLIEHISEVTITKSKTIKEEYKEIYTKHVSNIDYLKMMDLEVEALVKHKLHEFSLVRWTNKGSVYSVIEELKKAVESSEKEFENDKMQFINKWQKEGKEALENLLIRSNDELKDSFGQLKYNTAMYEKRMGELTPPYATLILLALVFLIVLIAMTFYIRAFFRNRTLKQQETKMMDNSICSIDEEKEESVVYASGLDEVRNEVKNNEYYIVDMDTVFADTVIKKVYISKSCILGIHRFFLEFLKLNGKTNETGCFMIGRWEQVTADSYNISLEEIIEPGDDAIYGEYELDFGTQIGIGLESTIINFRQATQKDYVQTCWMHSHPSMGLFLSNHDLIVQSQLVYPEHPTRMLAIVIDSNTEDLDTAFFTYKKTGEMNNKEDIKTIFSFEKMAQWAKGRQLEKTESIILDKSHYFEIISNNPDAKINTFLFSGASIIDMDYEINPNAEGLKGYFYGRYLDKSSQKEILIENFNESKTRENEEPIGCLLVLPQFTYQSALVKYESIINLYNFFVVYNPLRDDIKIISRSSNGKYLIASERDLHLVQMIELRKWTRRRRN